MNRIHQPNTFRLPAHWQAEERKIQTMEYPNLYKSIYSQSGVSRKVRVQWWAVVCTVVGCPCGYLFLTLPQLGAGLSALLLGMTFVGIFGLLTLAAYYAIGDKFAAIYTGGQRLEHRSSYYPLTARPQLIAALESDNMEALNRVKRGIAPQLVLVQYTSPDGKISFAQLMEDHGGQEFPISPIYKCETQKSENQPNNNK